MVYLTRPWTIFQQGEVSVPVLQIRGLPQKDPRRIQEALKDVCLAIAEAYGCEASNVWATWDDIEGGFYCEGDVSADIQPLDTHPPIAQLVCFEGKSAADIERTLLAASRALGKSLEIPGNVFITYHEMKSGHVVAGNDVVRKK